MRTAKVTSPDEVQKAFGGPKWSGPGWDGDRFEGSYGPMRVDLEPASILFNLRVQAIDDPSDSEDIVTEDPVKALAEFLGEGIPGSEVFERMSSRPSSASRIIRWTAKEAPSLGRRDAVKILRRIMAAASSSPRRARTAREQNNPDADALEKLEKRMKEKGWQVRSDDGSLTVDVSGVFEAQIEVDTTTWSYKFSLPGYDDLTDEGQTDDPIRDFRRWYMSRDVDEAISEKSREKKQGKEKESAPLGKTEPEAPQSMKTEPGKGRDMGKTEVEELAE